MRVDSTTSQFFARADCRNLMFYDLSVSIINHRILLLGYYKMWRKVHI